MLNIWRLLIQRLSSCSFYLVLYSKLVSLSPRYVQTRTHKHLSSPFIQSRTLFGIFLPPSYLAFPFPRYNKQIHCTHSPPSKIYAFAPPPLHPSFLCTFRSCSVVKITTSKAVTWPCAILFVFVYFSVFALKSCPDLKKSRPNMTLRDEITGCLFYSKAQNYAQQICPFSQNNFSFFLSWLLLLSLASYVVDGTIRTPV